MAGFKGGCVVVPFIPSRMRAPLVLVLKEQISIKGNPFGMASLWELFVQISGDNSGFKQSVKDSGDSLLGFDKLASDVGGRVAGYLSVTALAGGILASAGARTALSGWRPRRGCGLGRLPRRRECSGSRHRWRPHTRPLRSAVPDLDPQGLCVGGEW